MSDMVDEEFRAYIERMPGAHEAFFTEPTYSMQMKWVRRMLEVADMAMEGEEVSEESRRRVIRMVLFGSPDPNAAEERAARVARVREMLMRQPVSFPRDLFPGEFE